MSICRPAAILLILAQCVFSGGGAASASEAPGLRFHWEDAFPAGGQRKLRSWIEDTHAALEALVGSLPFEVHVHLHRRDGAREPVPWAHTRRSRQQGVHFYVDPRFPADALRRDWTASHELSHLLLPYLGSQHAWFAEGFASYMQYQVMHAAGVLSASQVAAHYRRNLERAERQYHYADRPFAQAAPALRAEGKYPTLYWGGAIYFLQVDQELRRSSGQGLIGVLREYLACCRRGRSELVTLVAELDRLAASDVFGRHLRKFQSEQGFPRFRHIELQPGYLHPD